MNFSYSQYKCPLCERFEFTERDVLLSVSSGWNGEDLTVDEKDSGYGLE